MKRFVMDAMTRNPVMTGPNVSVARALEDARERGVHHVIVTDGARVVGIASVDELAAADAKRSVGEVATDALVTIEQRADLSAAEELMNRHDVDCLPVLTWEGLLVGVLSRGDVRRAQPKRRSGERPKPRCASCGATSRLVREPDLEIAFCEECLARARASHRAGDEGYVTLGGGD